MNGSLREKGLYGGGKLGVDFPLDQSYREMRIVPGVKRIPHPFYSQALYASLYSFGRVGDQPQLFCPIQPFFP